MKLRFVGLLMGGALLGKLLGFARELGLARIFGISFVADSFRGALTVVLLPIAPLSGDMVPAVLVPLYREWDAQGAAARRFGCVAMAYVLIASTIAATVALAAGWWADLIVGGFGPVAHALTVRFVRIMTLAMPASALLVCLSSAEIALGRSRLTSLRASIQNIAILGGLLIAWGTGDVLALAWAFSLSFNLLALWGLATLWREGVLAPPGWSPRAAVPVARVFLARVRPLLAQPVAEQGNIWLERTLGSRAGIGVIASLDYARTLTETAVFLVSQPIGYAVLAASKGRGPVRSQVAALAAPVLALAMPASVFLAMFSPDIVRLVFSGGAFGAQGVHLTAGALLGISTGLWAATLGWILVRILNAHARNRDAAIILVGAYAGNALVNLLLVHGPSGSFGSFGLGAGEATRGIVLLAGTAIALGCGFLVLRLALFMVPGCAVLVWVAASVRVSWPGPVPRLAAGSAACALVAALMLLVLSQPARSAAGRMSRAASARLQNLGKTMAAPLLREDHEAPVDPGPATADLEQTT